MSILADCMYNWTECYLLFPFLSLICLSHQVAILAMEAEEENLSEEKKLSLGQEVR